MIFLKEFFKYVFHYINLFVYTEKSMSEEHPCESCKLLYLEAKLVNSYFSVSVSVRENLWLARGFINFCFSLFFLVYVRLTFCSTSIAFSVNTCLKHLVWFLSEENSDVELHGRKLKIYFGIYLPPPASNPVFIWIVFVSIYYYTATNSSVL